MSFYISETSTYNPNMPLCGLLYYGRLYDAYITKNEINIYGREKISILTPKYVVFYNGLEEHEYKEILRLSDLFERSEKSSEECYEWTATMLNINKGVVRQII